MTTQRVIRYGVLILVFLCAYLFAAYRAGLDLPNDAELPDSTGQAK